MRKVGHFIRWHSEGRQVYRQLAHCEALRILCAYLHKSNEEKQTNAVSENGGGTTNGEAKGPAR